MNHHRLAALSAALFLGAIASTPALAQNYTITNLGSLKTGRTAGDSAGGLNASGMATGQSSVGNGVLLATSWNPSGGVTALPGPAGANSDGLAINSAGQIAGYDTLATGATNAVIWSGAAPTVLAGPSGSTGSAATAINDAGQVAGYAKTASGQQAVVWNGSAPGVLVGLGGSNDAASGLNNAGQVVGYSATAAGAKDAVVWNGMTITTLTGLGGTDSAANAINASGQIAGYSSNGTYKQAVIWNGTTPTVLASLGKTDSVALAINDLGQAVGYSITASGVEHATLWSGGTVTDLSALVFPNYQFPGSQLLLASGINDNGSILALVGNPLLGVNAVELTVAAVPEPAGLGLVFTGLAFATLVGRRRRSTL